MMRLSRYLARAGVASRRAAERLISEGRVAVNGCAVREQGVQVDEAADEVSVDGARVLLPADAHTIMLNKPAGYLTTMADDRGRHTVAELLPLDRYPGLYPMGRLDLDTTGLLLCTTDGALGHALLHPSHHVQKRYLATVEGDVHDSELACLREGIMLDDGMTAPADVEIVRAGTPSTVSLRIHEGRKRQVKRMMAAIGHSVVALHRDEFAGLRLDGLAPGEWRELTAQEQHLLDGLASR